MPDNFARLHVPFSQRSHAGDSVTLCLTSTQDFLHYVSRGLCPDPRQCLPLSCLNQMLLVQLCFWYESQYKCGFLFTEGRDFLYLKNQLSDKLDLLS